MSKKALSQSRSLRPHSLLRRIGALAALVIALGAAVLAGVYWHDPLGHWLGLADHPPHDGMPGMTLGQAGQPATKQLWTCGMHPQVIQDEPGLCPICNMQLTPIQGETGAAAGGERKIKYWWDPMLGPSSISDKPGKSAMGMDLVPVYEDEISGGPSVTIDPVVVQNMGVRLTPVSTGTLMRKVRAVGYLAEAQPNRRDVNLLVSGWVRKLYADTEGMHLREGEPLFDLYSPEVQVAIEELITARHAAAGDGVSGRGAPDALERRTADTLYRAALRKLELWGLPPAEVDRLSQLKEPPATVTFTSPITGHVTETNIVEGAAVKAGDRALRIVDHGTLWLDAQVFEQDLPLIGLGQNVVATVEALPNREFEGEVIFIHPHVDPMTRAATVRIAVPNPDITLRPGMYATVRISAEAAPESLLVPREAIIDTGTRQVVFVAMGNGRFEPRQVKTGLSGESGGESGMVQVISGLAPGEMVVTSGQFMLDAESRIKEAIQKHLSAGLVSAQPPPATSAAPAPAKESPAAVPEAERLPWSPQVDKVYAAYLEMARHLGAPQESADAPPPDVSAIADAVAALVDVTPEPQDSLARDVLDAAAVMRDRPLDEQRGLFKRLSEAVIRMAGVCPPSTAVAERLFVAHCPMAPGGGTSEGDWLQTSEDIANPYFATEMKQCGEITATIEATPASGGERP